MVGVITMLPQTLEELGKLGRRMPGEIVGGGVHVIVLHRYLHRSPRVLVLVATMQTVCAAIARLFWRIGVL